MLIKKHFTEFHQVPLDATDLVMERAQEKADKRTAILREFYEFIAHEFWDVDARGYAMKGKERVGPPTYPGGKGYAKSDIENYIATQDMNGYVPTHYAVYGGGHPSWCGQGELGGKRTVCYRSYNASCNTKILIHEVGHNLGARHAGTLEGENYVEYGDMTSIQSITTAYRSHNAPHMDIYGLFHERERLVITEDAEILVCPVEMSHHALREDEHTCNIVRIDGQEDFYISLRKNRRCRFHGGNWRPFKDAQTLYIHERTPKGHAIRYLPDLRPGQSKYVKGFTLEHLGWERETARVKVVFGNE